MRARRGLGLVTAGIVLGGLLLAGPARAERAGPGPRAAARVAPATRAGAGLVDWEPPTDSVLVINQPDGSTFKASLTPAEDGGHLEQDGFTVVKADDGWWRYAEADATGALVPGRAAVGAAGAPAGLAAGIGRSVKSAAQVASDPQLSFAAQLQGAIAAATKVKAAAPAAAQGGGPTVFKFPVLMLATWWDADAGQKSPQFQPGSDTPAHFKAILDGFGGNPKGSLTEYYFENSYGQFLVQVDVYGPYVSALSKVEGPCYYGGIDPPDDPLDDLDPLDTVLGAGGGGAAGMTAEVVPMADPDVDFSKYDNNHDGYVDFMGIVHSGADMAVTGDPCNTWSHALPLSTFGDIAEGVLGLPTDTFRGGLPTTDAVIVDRVFTMPEFDEKGGGLDIGVASHEMAHALGEPDYYAVNTSSSGDGDWDIMSGGSYMGNPSGSNPSWFNPATRVFQGWVTPTIVHSDLKNYTIKPRETLLPGYTVAQTNPNLLLVPTRWIKVGQTDDAGHKWSTNDVYGLVQDGGRGYVIEGWYLEYVSRVAGPGDPIHATMTRSPYFDRQDHGSGLLTWHFDYWRRSNVYFGANNAQDDPNRMQVDVEEWDFNDNTQDIALNLERGEGSDPVHPTATGITSGTHRPNPTFDNIDGDPQASIPLMGGPTTPVPNKTTDDAPFTVDANPANLTMRVHVGGVGDCKLQLIQVVNGQELPRSDVVDSGSVGDEEEIIVSKPEPGSYIARVSDFAGCLNWSGAVDFDGPSGFDATGTADTFSNFTQAPTGWAFTNIRSEGTSEGLDLGSESGFANQLTLDVVNLSDAVDVSAGYVKAAANPVHGRGVVTAGAANPMTAQVFSNGGQAPGDVTVTVRSGSASGPVVYSGTVSMGSYENQEVPFTFTPPAEGPWRLVTTVSAAGDSEPNDTQVTTGWAGPASPSVLVVDDEGYTDGEDAYTGALAALGVPYAVATNHVDAATMAQYHAVIWVAAIDRGPGQLNADDRQEIADYLDGGGQLWLASNRAAGALEVEDAAAFLHGYFGGQTVETTTLEKPHVVSGTGKVFPEDLSFELQPYPIRPFSDVVELAAGGVFGTADQVLTLTTANKVGRDGSAFGTRVVGDEAHGEFRTVLTPFSLSQASSADTWMKLTAAVMDDFGVTQNEYTPSSRDPLVFHPEVRQQVSGRDTPVTAVVLGGTAGQPVTLYYRVHATDPFTALPMSPGAEPGAFNAVIPGSAVTPSGVDYYIKAGAHSTYDPAPAADGQLTHEIAVAIPEVAAPVVPVEPGTPEVPGTPSTPRTEPTAVTGGTEQLWLVGLLLGLVLAVRRLKTRVRP